ncbi:MAG: hypothetical protein EOP48_34620 [Sphingobacteriales bacterium]|nr:MAG: hypothetical protein EOP48_34620 [Sphingobacteriales bacterium]
MDNTIQALRELYDRIPRRHSADNVKEIYSIIDEYETLLQTIEAVPAFEKNVAPFFDGVENIRIAVKKSSDNKASKKQKDDIFDEASGDLKDGIESVVNLIEAKPA